MTRPSHEGNGVLYVFVLMLAVVIAVSVFSLGRINTLQDQVKAHCPTGATK